MSHRLSVCFLTRNEERSIAQALRSVQGVADQVLVVDTGSRDRTAQIAAELGAEVCPFAWEEDFAAGRNFSIARARGDWILWITASEELTVPSQSLVRECLSRNDAFAFNVEIENLFHPDQHRDVSQVTSDVRLFRRRPDLEFLGRLHPTFHPRLVDTLRREGQRIHPSAIRVRHHAYLMPVDEPKLRWMARLLELELRDRPGRLHYLVEQGRVLLELRDPRGHEVFAEAAAQVGSLRDRPAAPDPSVQVLLKYLLTVSAEQCRAGLTREEARDLAQRWFPNSPMLLWVLAGQCHEKSDFRQATQLLARLVSLGRSGTYDRSSPFEPGIVGEDALANLGACHGRLQEWDKAEACYRELLDSRKYRVEARHNLGLIHAARQKQGSLSFTFDSGTRT